jgi:octaprenyl-diphosphate synthase
VYFRLIADKTASLLAAACQLGAVSASDNEEDVAAMKEFGENLGMAFQIRDDLLDILGVEKNTGKPLGNDIRENKVTLPMLYALKQAERREARRIIRMIRRRADKQELAEIIQFVQRHGGVQYATQIANEYSAKALRTLERYPDNAYKEALVRLVKFITTRES